MNEKNYSLPDGTPATWSELQEAVANAKRKKERRAKEAGLFKAFEQTMDGARRAIPDALHHPIRQYMRRAILDNRVRSRAALQETWKAFYDGWHSRELQAKAESVKVKVTE